MTTCYLETRPVSRGTRSHDKVQEVLKPPSYRYDEAIERLELVLRRFHACDEHQEAFDEWTRLDLSNLEAHVEKEEPETSKALATYFKIFNRMFFSNGLSPAHCTLEFIDQLNVRWKAETNGSSTDERHEKFNKNYEPSNIKSRITLYERIQPDAPKRLGLYIGTLLHEMLHSYFIIYTCMCKACRRKKRSTDGHTGHGFPWQLGAKALGDFMDHELKLKVDLHRVIALGRELSKSGAKPSKIPFSKLGMKRDEIEDSIRRWKMKDMMQRKMKGVLMVKRVKRERKS